MKFAAVLAIAVTTLAVAGTAAAQSFQRPEDAIRYRQGAFRVMSAHFGTLGAMANGRMPYDPQVAARSGDVIAIASTLPWAGFAPGTDKGENTRAKGEVWSENAKFRGQGEKMQAEMQKLAAAAKTGNLDNLKAQFGPAAATCKACHDDFRRD